MTPTMRERRILETRTDDSALRARRKDALADRREERLFVISLRERGR
jgi:hypothetical protein